MFLKEKWLLNIIKGFVLASLFAPLVVFDYSYFPFIVPKTIFFQVLVELALFFYLILVFSKRSYAPKLDMMTRAVLLFFGVTVLAALFGENIFRSFFGVFERMLGVFNLAHFVVLFLILRSVLTEKRDWILLFRTFVFSASLVGLYGLGQKLNLSFLYNAGASRIDATIGNAAFFAAYMMFNAFFSMFLLFVDKSKLQILYWITLFISLLGVYLSETRGAILGLLFGLLFFLYALLKRKYFDIKGFLSLNKKKFSIVAVGLLTLSVGAFYLFGSQAFLDPIKRIGSISLEDSTTKTRILSAGVSWHGFLEHPVLGWGPENYNLVFDKYYDPRLYPTEIWFDHAHNIVFDNLVAAGVLGFLSYILIFLAAFYLLSHYSKIGKNSFFVSYLFVSLLIAYTAQNLFVFDALATYLPFFITLAFIGFMTLIGRDEKEVLVSKFRPAPVGISLVFLVLVGSSIYFLNVKPAISSYYGIMAIATSPTNPSKILDYYDKSLAWGLFGKPELRSRMIDSARDVVGVKNMPEDLKRNFLDRAESEGFKAIEEEPKNFRYYSYLAGIVFLDKDNKDFVKKIDLMMSGATDFAPHKPTLYLQKYQIKALLGENDAALRGLKMALDLHYDLKLTMVLALNYRELGRRDEALYVYDSLLKRQDLSSQERLSVAVEFASMGENGKAIGVAQNLVESDPTFSANGLKFVEDVRSGKFREVR